MTDTALLRQAQALFNQGNALLSQALAGAEEDSPAIDPAELADAQRYGEVCYQHLLVEETKGWITIQDSRVIRRKLYPSAAPMRATASFFGRKGENALFYRDIPTGAPVRTDQIVKFNPRGRRLAELWRELSTKAA